MKLEIILHILLCREYLLYVKIFNRLKNNKFILNESLNSEAVGEAVKKYWIFIFDLLRGGNPDKFYRQNSKEIDYVASLLRMKFPKSIRPLYRGILLSPHEVENNKVKHQPEITYVSFSEDKDIAVGFGDIDNPISSFVKNMDRNKTGYLITKNTYDSSIMLFHYEWLNDTKAMVAYKRMFGEYARYAELQKEVVLKPESTYEVQPVIPGSSNEMDVGKE